MTQEPIRNKPPKKLKQQLEEDQYLWQALKLGDPQALNDLFDKYYNDLFFYGLKLVDNRNRVADTIQDMFANLWEKRKKISKVTYIKAYLFTAFRNNLLKPKPGINFIETDTNRKPNFEYGFNISPEEIYLDNETLIENKKIIESLLIELSPKQKEIIYLKFYGNYSNIEISKIISIKQQSVSNLLIRTIKILQKKQKQLNLPAFNMLISGLL